jgi:hypothetical protein
VAAPGWEGCLLGAAGDGLARVPPHPPPPPLLPAPFLPPAARCAAC